MKSYWLGWKRTGTLTLTMALIVSASSVAMAKNEQEIDSGTFGVFVKGKRVINENFSIHQADGASIVKSQLKEAPGAPEVEQKSELEMGPKGDLIRYDWSAIGGGSLEVLPKNEFLIERITPPNSTKPAEQPFLMPNTSFILDNNFFVQREVLAWRYLASDCKVEAGQPLKCHKAPTEFGVLVPQDRTSMRVKIQLVGTEKVTIHSADKQLLRLNLSGDGFEWHLWVDGNDGFKLMRIEIPADDIEVVRD